MTKPIDGLLPRLVLLLLHHEAQVLLGRVRILGVLEDHAGEEQRRLGRMADRTDRKSCMADVLRRSLAPSASGDVLRRVVDRDAVVGQADLARRGRPCCCSDRARTACRARRSDTAPWRTPARPRFPCELIATRLLLVHHLAAERPDQPVAPAVGVARWRCRARSRAACRSSSAPGTASGSPSVSFGNSLKPGGLHVTLAVVHAIAAGTQRQRDPAPAAHAVGERARVPGAVFLAEVLAQVADVEQLVRILVRVVVGAIE